MARKVLGGGRGCAVLALAVMWCLLTLSGAGAVRRGAGSAVEPT